MFNFFKKKEGNADSVGALNISDQYKEKLINAYKSGALVVTDSYVKLKYSDTDVVDADASWFECRANGCTIKIWGDGDGKVETDAKSVDYFFGIELFTIMLDVYLAKLNAQRKAKKNAELKFCHEAIDLILGEKNV